MSVRSRAVVQDENQTAVARKPALSKLAGGQPRLLLGTAGNRTRQQQAEPLKKPLAAPVTTRKPVPVAAKARSTAVQKTRASQKTECSEPPFSYAQERQKLKSYSSGLLPLVDIDAADADDPFLTSEYAADIYLYLRLLEDRLSVQPNHMDGGCVTGKMREVLIDWLVQVHLKFKLLPETLYLCVGLLDRFLQKDNTLQPARLQMAGVTAMWIASKFEEIYAPELNDFIVIADHSFTGEQVRAMERKMLAALHFEPSRPLPLHFLRRCSKAGMVDSRQHALAKYLMELSLQEYSLAHVAPSRLAAAALCLSLQVLADEETTSWSEQMHHYSFYSQQQLQPLVCRLAALAQTAFSKVTDQRAKRAAVARKYANKKFFCISTMAELNGPLISELASQASDAA